ncbi:RNA-binding protein 7 [Frankliniella fusca]|uniref:RNA-binding protein 7 n=1 Tax=Frankliniella fusca TaxID=407009 RepID=A0AAE1LS03_9NEOP|nr:RNA-binding protein 7 [Frankliniella fusca]
MNQRSEENDAELRKLYCGNLDEKVDEEILFELFLQAGPIERIHIPRSKDGAPNPGYAFIIFKHECSVPYAIELFEDTALFGKIPKLRSRAVSNHHRSQSAPVNHGQYSRSFDIGCNAQMDFDSLLQMSRNMLNTGPPVGYPVGMPSAMAGTYAGMPISMGPPHRPPAMSIQPPPPGMSPPMPLEPLPPGEEVLGISNCVMMNRDALSQSSLQGNWSARNSSHMLPAEESGRGRRNRNSESDHYRRDYYGRGHFEQGGDRYDNCLPVGNRYNEDYYSRDRNYDDYGGGRNERNDYRSRSHNRHNRKGRY